MTETTNDIQEILTVTGLLNYAYFAEPYKNKDGKLSYKTHVILELTSPDVQRIKDAQRKIAVAAWEGDAVRVLTKLAAQDKLALHEGAMQEGEEYQGKCYISCNGKKPPTVVATLGNPPANVKLDPSHPLYPRSTDTAAVMFAMYAQGPKRKPSDWGERINCQLMGVQTLSKGAGIGGGGRIARVDEFGINPADADASIPMSQADVGQAGGLF